MNPHELIELPGAYDLADLLEALRILKCLHENAHTEQLLVKPISGQLRALLTDRSRNSNALFFRSLKHFRSIPDIYFTPFEDERQPDVSLPEPVMHFVDIMLTRFRAAPNQQKGQLTEKILDFEIFKVKGRTCKLGELINLFANKRGGAHYSRRMTNSELDLIDAFEEHKFVLTRAISQLASYLCEIGYMLFREAAGAQIIIHCQLRRIDAVKPMGLAYLGQIDGNASIALFDNMGLLAVDIRDVRGTQTILSTSAMIPRDKVCKFAIDVQLTRDFRTRVSLFLDSVLVQETLTGPIPLFFLPKQFHLYINGDPRNSERQESEMILSKFSVGKGSHAEMVQANIISVDRPDPIDKMPLLAKGTFGYVPSLGVGLPMTFEGSVGEIVSPS